MVILPPTNLSVLYDLGFEFGQTQPKRPIYTPSTINYLFGFLREKKEKLFVWINLFESLSTDTSF